MTSALRQPGARVAPLIQPYSLRNPRAKLGEVGPNCLPPLGLRPRGWKAVGADLPALCAGVRPRLPMFTKADQSILWSKADPSYKKPKTDLTYPPGHTHQSH